MRTLLNPRDWNPLDAPIGLTRLLDALEAELIEASEEEILQAAQDLGMNPHMQGSAAFAGIFHSAKPRLADFYDIKPEKS